MGNPVVQIEGVGNVQFPASMSEDEIGQAAHKLYTGAAAKNIEANPPSVPKPAAPEMEPSYTAKALNPTQSVAGPGEGNFIAEHPEEKEKMLGAALIGAGGASGAIPAVARKVAPYAVPAAASYAINKARAIPGVGPIIAKIPYAEAIPWLMSGKGKEAEEGGVPIERDATKMNEPYAGEAEEMPEVQGKPTIAAPSPGAIEPQTATPAKVGDLLNEGLGGKPLQPNVPLRQQGQAAIPTEPGTPAGHTAVESSAMKSYKYDPDKREFEFVTPNGGHFIHGDVSPEQAAEFEAAASKGKAMNAIKKGSTYVGKMVNGKRVNVQPGKQFASAAP